MVRVLGRPLFHFYNTHSNTLTILFGPDKTEQYREDLEPDAARAQNLVIKNILAIPVDI
jgi:hypothetical protein